MAKTWLEPTPTFVPDALREYAGGHDLIAQTLARRGISTIAAAQAFLDPAYYRPASPYDLPEMDRAVERIRRVIQGGEIIAVWGDFDVDGQTATALLVSALRDLGGQVRYHIPNRLTEGHGVHIPRLKTLIGEGVRLILTCDTGIAAHDAVDYARSRGVDVVITDHHQLPAELPAAWARVNPQRLAESHPLRTLPGVGVAYKLAEALYDGRDTTHLLDLVALGIVADVALLTGDTRYLLQQGLAVLRQTTRPGLQAMITLAGINPAELSEQHIGFMIGPRLNALGRLADANPAVELLTTTDQQQAQVLAAQLEGLNNERKLQSSQVYGGAKALIEKDPSLLDYAALVLSHPAWPGGVVGIVANKLVEEYQRPVILISTPEGEPGRGSARSVAGCDITAAIAAHSDMLLSFGGHTMAAGLSIDPARIADFRRALSRTVRAALGEAEPTPTLAIDGYVPLGDLSLALVRDVERLAPFGPGNPPLTLAAPGLRLNRYATIGRRGEHLAVTVEDEAGATHRVLWWGAGEDDLPRGRFDLAYTMRASSYLGEPQVQVEWVDARPVEDEAVEADQDEAVIEVGDFRLVSDPQAILRQLMADEPGLQIWREAGAEVAGQGRDSLAQSAALAVWTIPPGSREWWSALEQVRPMRVYLFAVDPGLDALEPFVRRLAGLVKHVLNAKGGLARLDALAVAMAHRVVTVRAGLDWLAAQGQLRVVMERKGEMLLAADGVRDQAARQQAEAQLVGLLAETRAYRAYWREAAGYNLTRSPVTSP
jgi:single-stranded-DNA-specific exonuclease